jgi:hypothetical protein
MEEQQGVGIDIVVALADSIATEKAAANVEGMTFLEERPNGDTIHRLTFTNGTHYDLLTHAGVASYKGQYLNLSAVQTAFPNGIADTQFIFTYDEVTTENPKGTGVVSLLQYIGGKWTSIKLNQSIPSGVNPDQVGFSGGTTARLALLNNVDWNTKEFLYLDTDLHTLMLYKPSCMSYLQYEGQVVGTVAPMSPSDGDIWQGTETVYTWDNIKKFWKVKLSSYIVKCDPEQNGYFPHVLNGAELRIHRDSSDNMWISIYQNNGMDTVIYSLNDSAPTKVVLAQGEESVIVPSNIAVDQRFLLTTELVHSGDGQAVDFVRYGNAIYITEYIKLLVGDTSFTSMTTSERLLYLTDASRNKKRFVYDTDLGVLMQYIPNSGNIGSFVEFRGQAESGSFPYIALTNGMTYISGGKTYAYNQLLGYWSYNGEAPIKNNMSATAQPTIYDDNTKGYSDGSVWIYNAVTYICQSSITNNAVWVSSADIFYFETWEGLTTAISVIGTTYVHKYAVVTNANGGNGSGTTYVNGQSVPNQIVDSGTATYYINTQGSSFSVTCQKRQITNPVIASVMLVSALKPVNAGYHIFTVTPSDGLPSGCMLNDICYYDGATWSRFQSYATAPSVIVVGITTNTHTSWRKFQGTWMNTADEYIPDGLEYQTGKTWNNKPVFRKCCSGNTGTIGTVNAVSGIPTAGIIITYQLNLKRSDNKWTVLTGNTKDSDILIVNGVMTATLQASVYMNATYIGWVEYTKS